MGRKSNSKDPLSSPSPINDIDKVTTKDQYRKRLRSWKRTPTQMTANHLAVSSVRNDDDDDVEPFHRSTIYTYPVNFHNNHKRIASNTILAESLTTESAFYSPSISNTSVQTIADLNNNHVTTLQIENKKRKTYEQSSESLSSEHTQIRISENDEKIIIPQQISTNNVQLPYRYSPTKRSRISSDGSLIMNHRSLASPLLADDDTIDINQLDHHEPLSSCINNESLVNNSYSMETAVKMIQPIVDIIFHAFEDQLKNVQKKSIQSSPSITLSAQQSHPPTLSPVYPIVLHAVNFNIQLDEKQSRMKKQISSEQYLTNTTLNEHTHSQFLSLTELKRKVVSYILSDHTVSDLETNDGYRRKRRQLRRIVQIAALGVSVLCGYLLL